jgi:hypothetical protein
MPAQTQSRTESQVSFRLAKDDLETIVPALTERWGEPRARAISRALQAAWTVESLRRQGFDIPQPQIGDGDGGKSRPISFRPSTADMDIISDLMRWWGGDLATVIGRALRLAYHDAIK